MTLRHDVPNIHNTPLPVRSITPSAAAASWPLVYVISGGQTGVDITALRAAQAAGYYTGGMMPRGGRTDDGPHLDWAAEFGLQFSKCVSYGPRTWWNARAGDGTLWLGEPSAGRTLTLDYCVQLRRPTYCLDRLALRAGDEALALHADFIKKWIVHHQIITLNVAGNRERTQPGISAEAARLLKLVLTRHVAAKDQTERDR